MEFTGREVADAIQAACEHFHVSREDLRIEVLETGSAGIFGLIRKKARIRAELRQEAPETTAAPARPGPVEERITEPSSEVADDAALAAEQSVSPESQVLVRDILGDMLRLLGMPSAVEMSANGLVVTCAITGPFEKELVGQDGRVIDSLQYLLRKIAVRRCAEPLRIAVNVGDFRERRLEQLRAMATELAHEVRQNGKTRVIPALNPAERREIHLLLQDDPEVRSRSVGEGVFKRVLIFKPGRPSGKTGTRRSAKREETPASGG
ncbi:MAG TPA: RNA-binding protein [Desulfobulbaceae bacterium]|nr:RNA-binding protein [Desulfobulbaceae bacterium]